MQNQHEELRLRLAQSLDTRRYAQKTGHKVTSHLRLLHLFSCFAEQDLPQLVPTRRPSEAWPVQAPRIFTHTLFPLVSFFGCYPILSYAGHTLQRATEGEQQEGGAIVGTAHTAIEQTRRARGYSAVQVTKAASHRPRSPSTLVSLAGSKRLWHPSPEIDWSR